MNGDDRLVAPKRAEEDTAELALRPQTLDDFAGQKQVRENLKIFIAAARGRGEALDHVLFHGPPGRGKTTLAQIVAREMGVGFRATSGPVIQKAGDLAAQDRATLSRPAGVGPKLAARLATELKDKAAAFGVAPVSHVPAGAGTAVPPAASVNEDAVSALVNLGYRRVEAFGAVARVTQRLGEGAALDAVIRACLQELAR